MRQIYLQGVQGGGKPQSTQYEVLKEEAKKVLQSEHYNYVDGSASTQASERSNRSAFDQWQIGKLLLNTERDRMSSSLISVPRMLAGIDINEINLRTELFGTEHGSPFIVSPIGVQELIHPEADVATAKAAVSIGVPYTHSSAASTPLDDIAKQADLAQEDNHGWFQLYWPSDDKLTESILVRAKRSGYRVLVVTLDTWILGWRPKDLDAAYNPFLMGKGVANILSDPYFIEEYCDGKDPRRKDASQEELFQASIAAVGLLNPGISRKWSELNILRKIWGDAPIVLKGVLSMLDVNRAIEAGMDGIWVSNHGGRQVDGSISSLQALASIGRYIRSLPLYPVPGLVPTQQDDSSTRRRKPYVIFDSGIRCGADAMKALCLGADAVAIGRPWVWGLACNGQEGVEQVFKTLAADLELNMGLSGISAKEQLNPQVLVRAGQESLL